LTPSIPTATTRRPGAAFIAIVVVAFGAAALAGAYVDWIYWVEVQGTGLLLSLGALVLLVIGGLIALLAHGLRRRIAFVVLAVGVGLLAGQLLGPSREPLIVQPDGTLTLHLTSPIVADATGPAVCQNVASGADFQIGNDESTTRLDAADPAFVSIFINKGDRWQALGDAPRKDGVRLEIRITPTAVGGSGKPSTTGRQAVESSILQATFSNAGGSVTFANLEAMIGPDLGGAPMDLAGTIDWTCGAPVN
jgi:hypothetical protein